MMGIFIVSGSFVRIVGLIFVSLIYYVFGFRVIFVFMCGMILIIVIFVGFVYKRLVSFKLEKGVEFLD